MDLLATLLRKLYEPQASHPSGGVRPSQFPHPFYTILEIEGKPEIERATLRNRSEGAKT
jgi:hypothetical protein